jgi:uncharacterized protein YeaO (DUF488 family)
MDEMIQLKRAHDAESEEDGARFLVERPGHEASRRKT